MRSNGGTRTTPFGISLLLAAAAMCVIAALPAAAQIDWQGSNGGDWGTNTNWVGNVVPNGNVNAVNATANAIALTSSDNFTVNSFASTGSADFLFDGGSLTAFTPGTSTFSLTGEAICNGNVSLSGFVVTAGGGMVNGNGTTTLSNITFAGGTSYQSNLNTQTVITGTITNGSGSNFQIDGGGGTNSELILASSATLAGAGTVTLSTIGGGGTAYIQGSGTTLTNNSTIQGDGTIGNGSLAINNAGTINANVFDGVLTLNGGAITNTGTIEATNGGVVNVTTGGTVINAGGNLTVNSSHDSVLIEGYTIIQGGTLNNLNGGYLATPTGYGAVLDGSTGSGAVTINGTYTSDLNSATYALGTITNNGLLELNGGAGTNTELFANGSTLTLTGGGTVNLSTRTGGGSAYIEQNGTGTLINVNNTIQGEGIIGNNGLTLVNEGTINANYNGPSGVLTTTLTLEGLTGTTINTGLMEASNLGVLQINGGVINNAGGTIQANSGATVQLFGSTTIQGGTLNNNGGAFFGTPAGNNAILDGSTASGAITLNGTYTGDFSSNTYAVGTIVNNGNIELIGGFNGSGATNTALSANQGTLSLQGGGTVTLTTFDGGGNAFLEQNGTATLVNVNNTIQGEGYIGNNGLTLVNNGTINANSNGGTAANPQVTYLVLTGLAGTTINTGLMEASNIGALDIDGGIINNAGGGIIQANSGASVSLYGSTTIQGGTLNNNGGVFFGTPVGNNAILDGSTSSGAITLNGTYTSDFSTNTYILGTINNNNVIQVNGGYDGSGATNTALLPDSTNLILQGGGTVNLTTYAGGGNAYIEQNGSSTLINVNNTIQGEGYIGNNGLSLVNTAGGVIDANSTGGPLVNYLVLTGLGGATVNQGLMEATNNGVLDIDGGIINNLGGNITATGPGASVQLYGSTTIQGGTLNNTGGAFFGTPQGNTAILDGLTQGPITINGTYTSDFSTATYILGTIVNNNNILVNGGYNGSGATNTLLLPDSANVTLTGGGTVTLNTVAGGGLVYLEQNGGVTLTNVNNTIQGEGVIGNNGLTLVNTAGGTIDANSTGVGTINTLTLTGLVLTNQGLVEATNQGVLDIQGITVNNAGGNITANGAGAYVQIYGSSTIQGGVLNNNGGAFLGTVAGQTAILDGTTQGPITINGTYTSDFGSNTYLIGNINNQGNIQVNGGFNGSGATNTLLLPDSSTVLLTGGGTVTLNQVAGGGQIVVEQNGGDTLENFNNTIQGNGLIGNNGLSLLNDAGGTVLANVAGGTLLINGAGTVTNNGTFEVDPGSELHLQSVSNFTNFSGNTLTNGTYIVNGATGNAGTLQIDALGSTGGEIVNNAATIILNGPNSNFVDAAGLDALSELAANTTASSNLTITGGRTLTTNAGGFSNAGTVWVGTGSSFLLAGVNPNYTQSAGITTVNGTLGNLDPLSFNLNSGILAGTGTVIGNVIGTGGTIAPGEATTTGELTINGNLNDTGSALQIRLGGTGAGQWDQLDVTGSVNLGAGSVLDVSLLNGFTPTNGETFTFLDFSSLSSLGSPNFFGLDNGLTTPGGVFSIEELGGDNLTLTFTANSMPPPPPPPPPPGNGTPEPAPMVMLASGAVVWMLARRRNRK